MTYQKRSDLSRPKKRLLFYLQITNFGRIEGLVIRGGEPVFYPPPRIIRDYKPGGENRSRPEAFLQDFNLKTELVELFNYFEQIQDMVIPNIEIKHGLPVKWTDVIEARDDEESTFID
jgi:hypothetical protein